MTNTNTDRYTVHTRSRYGVYRLVGTAPTTAKAYRLMADEVTKGVAAQVWISYEGDKVYEWDHAFDTLSYARHLAACHA